MTNKQPNCPVCEIPVIAETRKEKLKRGSVKMAVNTEIFKCQKCNEEFVSEDEQRKYDMRVKNFHAKLAIQDKKVSTH